MCGILIVAIITAAIAFAALILKIVEVSREEMENRAAFNQIREIEKDLDLRVPGRRIRILVPINILEAKPPAVRKRIVRGIHDWIRSAIQSIPDGCEEHSCKIGDINTTLTTKVLTDQASTEGLLRIEMQAVADTFSEVIKTALHKKLPKLVEAKADKKILLLERQHMILIPRSILKEIEKQRISDPKIVSSLVRNVPSSTSIEASLF